MRRIHYLMSGQAHLPYLVASLNTLRRWWTGPVWIYAWPESYPLVSRIAEDDRLAVTAVEREPVYRGKNDQFLDKILMVSQQPPNDVLLYLDADTTIHGRLTPLFELAEEVGFCATQFNGWTTDSRMMRGRLGSLRDYPLIDHSLIDRVCQPGWPSVNGGVWASRPTSPVLPLWSEWTLAASVHHGTYIADEKVLHLLMAKFYPKELLVAVRGVWNCSPVYQPATVADSEVRVRHYHGDSNVRPDKSAKGHRLWWPIYQECLANNVGYINEWIGGVRNKWMDQLAVKPPST